MAAELIPFQPEPEKNPGEQLVDLPYEEQVILELCLEGKGRNEIANLTGLSTWKVSTVAAKHGHYFGRAAWLEVANATRAAQLKERKQRLALQLLDAAELYADAVTVQLIPLHQLLMPADRRLPRPPGDGSRRTTANGTAKPQGQAPLTRRDAPPGPGAASPRAARTARPRPSAPHGCRPRGPCPRP